MATVDLTIRGAGIFGLSIAWEAVSRGAGVRIIDPSGPGSGASGGVLGALQPHTPERWNAKKAFQFDSLIAAKAFWSDVDAASGLTSGYGRIGRLQPIGDEAALTLARARESEAEKLWQGRADWTIVAARPDWSPSSPTGWVIHDTLSARLHPRRACKSLAAALLARGAEVLPEGMDEGPVIWATGVAGLRALAAETGQAVGSGVKGQAALLDFDARGLPQVFSDTLHIVPHDDGTLAVGSTSEREFEDGAATDAHLEELIARVRQIMPALSEAPVIERWAGVRPRAKSRAPMLGPWPDRPGHFIANGGFKIGFGMAPGVARIMADLVLEDKDSIPTEFRVEENF